MGASTFLPGVSGAPRGIAYGRRAAPTRRWTSADVRPSVQGRTQVTAVERAAAILVEQARPLALRAYDQIPMRSEDLIRQVRLVAPLLADRAVAFVGDYDSASALIGLLGAHDAPCPSHMLVLDFDDRVLATLEMIARRHGFADRLEVRRYNVFDPVPPDLVGRYDWFYTNPPYGASNNGESGRLFIARGCELVRRDGRGCIILPDDANRPWTRRAMMATQQFMAAHNWLVRAKLDDMHHYHLDDDPHLASSLLLVEHVADAYGVRRAMPYIGRRVQAPEIPHFYGRRVAPPYPAHIPVDIQAVGRRA